MVLFVNACVRTESRTRRLADALIHKLQCEVAEVRLAEIHFPTVNADFLAKRDSLIAAGAWSDPMFDLARQFAEASMIIIAAPYWDLSFPAALKQYFEQINVMGITFQYTPEGTPEPLCAAKKLYYVTTAGGAFVPEEFGFGYVKTMAQSFYGIQDVELIKAVGLDIYGVDVEQILNDSINAIPDPAV